MWYIHLFGTHIVLMLVIQSTFENRSACTLMIEMPNWLTMSTAITKRNFIFTVIPTTLWLR